MLGKRGRPTLGRTTSMTEFTLDAPPSPAAAMIGGEYSHMLSPRFYRRSFSGADSHVETAEFLRRCGLCNRRLVSGRDIYMYRGETAFCSLDCREEQMKQDERRAAAKTDELAAATPGAPENVAAV